MKKKERMVFAGGVLAVALLVAVALVFSTSSPTAPAQSTGATTTPQATETQATAQKPAAPAAQAPVDNSVKGVASRLSNARTFAGLLSSTGVGASLTGAGPYTLFVPSDNAFGNMAPSFLSGLSAAAKKRLVQYHVVAGKALDLDAVSSGNHTALSRDTLNFNVKLDSMVAYVNSGVSISQHKAQNGIVYVISAVLVPPQAANPSTGSTGTPTP